MSTEHKAHSRGSTTIAVGEAVVLRDKQRGTIEAVTLESGEPTYTVRMSDGALRIVHADDLVRARADAESVAPSADWKGEERREGERRDDERREAERRKPERASPGRRRAERRKGDRRRRRP